MLDHHPLQVPDGVFRVDNQAAGLHDVRDRPGLHPMRHGPINRPPGEQPDDLPIVGHRIALVPETLHLISGFSHREAGPEQLRPARHDFGDRSGRLDHLLKQLEKTRPQFRQASVLD